MKLEPGRAVRVAERWPEAKGPVHIRTPHYIRGHRGAIVTHLGDFPNPEDLAFERSAASLPLYHVAFDAQEVWGPGESFELVVEVFGHWLEEEMP